MPIQHIDVLRSGSDGDELRLLEQERLPGWPQDEKFSSVGQRVTRVEGHAKVTGQARYSADIRLPGQLYARVLRSPHPHARIRHIDSSAAEQLDGVHAVISNVNAPSISWYEDSQLFDSTVRFVGDEVAAVAADSEEIARDAAALIEVDYEILPFNAEFSRAEDSSASMSEAQVYQRGDVEAGMAEADVVIEQLYRTQTALHNSLEPHGCTAQWDSDGLSLWESTQGIFEVREQVAEKLGLAEQQVRVIKHYMGGGFGSKQIAWKHAVIAALLAKRSSRPVQLMLDREAENLATGNRNATLQRVRIGARHDGTITAISAELQADSGAYNIGGEASMIAGLYQRLYRCANVRTEQRSVFLNTGPSVAFRAPGYVEGAFALESAMDELAHELQTDPLELRLKNYTETDQKDEKPYSSADGLRRCYDNVTKEVNWQNSQKPQQTRAKRYGIGIAAHEWGGAGHAPGYAWVKFNSDGSVDVVTATQDIGTGTRTALSQIAAEELGLTLERIRLHFGDTANGPYSPTSAGSATIATLGPAVRNACANAKKQLFEVAAKMLDNSDSDQLGMADGVISVNQNPDLKIDLSEVTSRIAPHMIQGHGARAANPSDKSVRTFGVQCAEVEVDIETGEITLLRLVAAHDCGRIINPLMVDSQVVGGITQGIGFALSEQRVVDSASGIVLNANLEDYKIPSVADIPPINHAAVNLADQAANSIGAKGIGEPPIIPTAPAIANAVFDAVGIRIRQLPLSRRQLLEALNKQRSNDSPED